MLWSTPTGQARRSASPTPRHSEQPGRSATIVPSTVVTARAQRSAAPWSSSADVPVRRQPECGPLKPPIWPNSHTSHVSHSGAHTSRRSRPCQWGISPPRRGPGRLRTDTERASGRACRRPATLRADTERQPAGPRPPAQATGRSPPQPKATPSAAVLSAGPGPTGRSPRSSARSGRWAAPTSPCRRREQMPPRHRQRAGSRFSPGGSPSWAGRAAAPGLRHALHAGGVDHPRVGQAGATSPTTGLLRVLPPVEPW